MRWFISTFQEIGERRHYSGLRWQVKRLVAALEDEDDCEEDVRLKDKLSHASYSSLLVMFQLTSKMI